MIHPICAVCEWGCKKRADPALMFTENPWEFCDQFSPVSDPVRALREVVCTICLLYTSPSPRDRG